MFYKDPLFPIFSGFPVTVTGGQVQRVDLQMKMHVWQGFYGSMSEETNVINVTFSGIETNVSFMNLSLAKCYASELYATTLPSINWGTIEIGNASMVNSYIGHMAWHLNATNVFTTNHSFNVYGTNLTLPSAQMNSQSGDYYVGVLKQGSTPIFVTNLEAGSSFNGVNVDYEIMLPASISSTETYNFFLDPTDDCDCPVLNFIDNITANESDLIWINATATDPNGDNLTFNFSSPFNTTGYWQTDYEDAGVYVINVSVMDTDNNTDSQLVYVTVNDGVPTGDPEWSSIILPEGVFEPYNVTLTGTHANMFSIRFTNLTISYDQNLACEVKVSNESIKIINMTGINTYQTNYTLNYTMLLTDSIVNDATVGYIPWVLKSCYIENANGTNVWNESTSSWNATRVRRIYVHSPNSWAVGEITRAVACAGAPGVYFNNTAKCEYQEDTKYAIQMYSDVATEPSCLNNPGVGGDSEYCRAIFFNTNDPLEYFGGFSASVDDPNGYSTFTVSFSTYNTPIAYTQFIDSDDGTFKLRVGPQTLSNKEFSITIYNLTDVESASAYGAESGGSTVGVSDNGDGTWNVYANRLASPFTGTLDFTFNISFNAAIDQDRESYIVIAYGGDSNQQTPDAFTIQFDSTNGLKNSNESQNTSLTTGFSEGPVCGDEVNNDFDYIGGTWANSYDCYDPDCDGSPGDNAQANEFGSGQTGICNYATELNCTDRFDNDYDGVTDCHDSDCTGTTACPTKELICNDGINSDWDFTKGESDSSST